MIKILLLPPILVSIYLVVINWSGMYQKPDIIGMPVVFEIMAFVLYFLVAVPMGRNNTIDRPHNDHEL